MSAGSAVLELGGSLRSREDGGWCGMAEIQRYLPGKVEGKLEHR